MEFISNFIRELDMVGQTSLVILVVSVFLYSILMLSVYICEKDEFREKGEDEPQASKR